VRHAQATQVQISLKREDQRFILEVQDNGVGFDPAWRKEASFGLMSIRERALVLGGGVDISSVPGRTVIRVCFPERIGQF
jgi:signal transduction histidine kinase